MDAASGAGMTLYGRGGVDNAKLVAVLEDRHLVARGNGDDREQSALRLPAFGAAAGMIVGGLRIDPYFDRTFGAVTREHSTGKIRGRGRDAVIDGRVNRDRLCHNFPLMLARSATRTELSDRPVSIQTRLGGGPRALRANEKTRTIAESITLAAFPGRRDRR